MASWLSNLGDWAVGRQKCLQPPAGLPDEIARPLKKLKEEVLPDNNLLEHLSDIMELSGYDAMMEFAHGCAPAMAASLPESVKSMFM